jgi:uncharacterized protein (TIRG00374 family)
LVDISLRGLRLHLVSRQVGEPISWIKTIQICLAVDFFAGITPSRIGGEPARMVGLLNQGMTTSRALIVLGIEAFMDLGYLVLAIPLFIWCTRGHHSELIHTMTSALGVIVLLLAIPGFLMMLKESNVPRIMGGIQQHLPLLYRLLSGFGRWDLQHWVGTLRRNMIEVMRGPKWYLLVGILCTCGWWTLRFGSLLWIAAALNFSISPLDVFWPQFLIYNSMILVPVPVSGGLFETSFLLLYKDMIPAAVMPTTLVLWRFFTYYLFLILGVVTTTRSMWRLTLRKLEKKSPVKTETDAPANHYYLLF